MRQMIAVVGDSANVASVALHIRAGFTEIGTLKDIGNSAEEIQNYAGIAPVTERSGQKSWVHWRWQCAKLF
jgi:hypothetical protein